MFKTPYLFLHNNDDTDTVWHATISSFKGTHLFQLSKPKLQKEKAVIPEKTLKPRGDLSLPPSKYRGVGWKKEMSSLMGSRKPISYIEEYRNPELAQKYDYSNLVVVNGYTKVRETN